MAASRLQFPQYLERLRIAILDPGGQTRERARIPLPDFLREVRHQLFSN
jgi:hypothetical protein